jgi:hypothetical protein
MINLAPSNRLQDFAGCRRSGGHKALPYGKTVP